MNTNEVAKDILLKLLENSRVVSELPNQEIVRQAYDIAERYRELAAKYHAPVSSKTQIQQMVEEEFLKLKEQYKIEIPPPQ